MNHKGMTFLEICLSLAILFVITGTVIPLSYQLKMTLYHHKLDYHASEVALDAAKMAKDFGKNKGSKTIEGIQYEWNYNGDEICVTYKPLETIKKKCIRTQKDI